MKSTAFVATVLALILSACGAPTTPTPDPSIVQASAVAVANTMIAMTQAAIPTATSTEVPSPTLPPSPTARLVPTVAATLAATSQADDCYHHPLQVGAAGPVHQTVIKNETDGSVNVSLTLSEPNAFGECGVLSYPNLGKNSSVQAGLPSGNWSVYAWGTGKGGNINVGGAIYVQPAQFLKLELCIRSNVVKYAQAC